MTPASGSPIVHVSVDEEFDEMFDLAPVGLAATETILRELVEGPNEAAVSITNDMELQRLNLQFRGLDKPTTRLQTSVPDDMRGRVLSVQSFGFGLSSVTGFQTGATAAWLGAPVAIAIGASIVAANGLRLLRGVSARFRDQQEVDQAEE